MVRVDEPNYSHDNSEGKSSNKKKTPLQYRKQEPKVKEATKPLTEAEKRLFKEAFITDKARLFKRQRKYDKESDCLIIIRDNVLGKGAQTKGKYMAYGLGNIKKDFLTEGIKFDADKFYMHANHTDFQMEAVPDQNRKRKEVPETQKSRKCCTCTCTADNGKNTNQRRWQLRALSKMIFPTAAAMETTRLMISMNKVGLTMLLLSKSLLCVSF